MYLALLSTAQNQNYHKFHKIHNPSNLIELPVLQDQMSQYIIDNSIKSIEIKRFGFKKNGKKKSYFYGSTYTYNEVGQITKIAGRSNKKEFGYSLYDYNQEGKVTSHKYYNHKGEIVNTYVQHFEGVDRAYIEMNKKGDTTVQVIRGLKNEGNISSDFYYKNGKLKYKWVNEYGADDKLEQITFYKKNGKVKYIWDYRCKEEGTETHKDTTTICTSITNGEDGTTTYVYQYINEKGELVKYINRLNSADKIVHYRRLKGVEEVIEYTYDITYDDDESTVMNKLSKFYKKGILSRVTDEIFNADGYFESSISTLFKKGAITSSYRRTYEYGTDGMPTKFIKENKTKKFKGVTEYRFTKK